MKFEMSMYCHDTTVHIKSFIIMASVMLDLLPLNWFEIHSFAKTKVLCCKFSFLRNASDVHNTVWLHLKHAFLYCG